MCVGGGGVRLVSKQDQAGYACLLLAALAHLMGGDAGPLQAEVPHPSQCNADTGVDVPTHLCVGMFPFLGEPLCIAPAGGFPLPSQGGAGRADIRHTVPTLLKMSHQIP